MKYFNLIICPFFAVLFAVFFWKFFDRAVKRDKFIWYAFLATCSLCCVAGEVYWFITRGLQA